MGENRIYGITEEETSRAKKARDAVVARLEELRKRLGEIRDIDDGSADAEKEALWKEIIGLTVRLGWQNMSGDDFIRYLVNRRQYAAAAPYADRLAPGYSLWADSNDEPLKRKNMLLFSVRAAFLMQDLDRFEEALAYSQLAYREFKLLEQENGDTDGTAGAAVYYLLPYCLHRNGQMEAAEPLTREAVRYWTKMQERRPPREYAEGVQLQLRNTTFLLRAVILLETGDVEGCGQLLRENALSQQRAWESVPGDNDKAYFDAMYYQSTFCMVHNRFEEAFEWLSRLEKDLTPGVVDPAVEGSVFWKLGLLHRRRGEGREAEACFEKAREISRKVPGNDTIHDNSFLNGKVMRSQLCREVEKLGEKLPDYMKPAALIPQEEWERIRTKFAPDADFADVVGFADESPRKDQSRGILILEQGLRIATGRRNAEAFSWYDIIKSGTRENKKLAIRLVGEGDRTYHWFDVKYPKEIDSIIREAGKTIRNKQNAEKVFQAPVPEPEIFRPAAVLKRF